MKIPAITSSRNAYGLFFTTLGYSRIYPYGGSLISIGGSSLEELSLTGIAHLAIALPSWLFDSIQY
jgi:hypothetical protein